MSLSIFGQGGSLRGFDKRRRKYLTAKFLLRLSPILPRRYIRKFERRLIKYSPNGPVATPQLRLPPTPRSSQIAADIRRLSETRP